MTFQKTVKKAQEEVHHALIMLKDDPHFQTYLRMVEEGREYMINHMCGEGMSVKDIDRMRGAIYFVTELLTKSKPNNNFKNGNSTLNAAIDSNEYNHRG